MRVNSAPNSYLVEMPLKKQHQIKNQAVETRVFTLKDLLGELSDRGISVHKITELPDSNLVIPGIPAGEN